VSTDFSHGFVIIVDDSYGITVKGSIWRVVKHSNDMENRGYVVVAPVPSIKYCYDTVNSDRFTISVESVKELQFSALEKLIWRIDEP